MHRCAASGQPRAVRVRWLAGQDRQLIPRQRFPRPIYMADVALPLPGLPVSLLDGLATCCYNLSRFSPPAERRVLTLLFVMQLRLFRHFVPVSVLLLVSSDALLITGAFYQLLSESEIGTPIVLGASSFTAQLSAGLSAATVTTMISLGLYGHQSFLDLRLWLSKIVVAFLL